MTVSITEFLNDHLHADAETARRAQGVFAALNIPRANAKAAAIAHIDRHSPGRVLADIVIKRAIIAEHTPDLSLHSPETPQSCPVCYYEDAALELHPCPTLRRMAAAYPDCPEEWRPTP